MLSDHVGYLLAGLGGGAAVAALSLGLVLCHRASGVVNFAHAALGVYSASAFFEFRESGDVVLPVLGLPARLHLLDRPTLLTAAVVVGALTALVGALIHLVAIRPLSSAPPLAKVAVTLGLFLYLQETVRMRFPPGSDGVVTRRAVLPDGPVRVLGTSVSQNRLLLAVIVVVAAVALGAVYRYTRSGLAGRAAAENERGALLVGLSPARLASAAWALAAVLAGAAVVLVEPIAGLGPATALLVVPALAAALPGRLESFPIAVAGGLAIGMVQSLVLGHAVRPGTTWIPTWLPTTGLQELVPVAIIVGVLVWRGDVLSGRGAPAPARWSPSPTPRHVAAWAVAAAAVGTASLLTFPAGHRQALIASMVFALLCLSFVVVTGYSGQISLLQVTVAGVGGFASVQLALQGLPFVIALVVAVVVATVVGVAAALPATRLRGASLAVATLAIAVVLERLVLQSTAVSGGAGGLRVPRPTLLGLDLGIGATGADNFRAAFGLVVLATLVASCVVVAHLRRGPVGLNWLAVRSNERAAASTGVDVRRAKLSAFAVASALAGTAGVLSAHSVETVSVQSFMVIGSVAALALTTLAGVARISGALVAGLLAPTGLLTAALTRAGGGRAGDHVVALSGLALVATVILAPDGLAALWASSLERARSALARPRPRVRTGRTRMALDRRTAHQEAGR
jgi:branched-chain amino acid transport system permease protein